MFFIYIKNSYDVSTYIRRLGLIKQYVGNITKIRNIPTFYFEMIIYKVVQI